MSSSSNPLHLCTNQNYELPTISSVQLVAVSSMEQLQTNETSSAVLVNLSSVSDHILLGVFLHNKRIQDVPYYSLVISYCCLIILGICGNWLVVYSVVRKTAMRTAHNAFILNLAFSDLLLCVVTMPLTLVEILSRYWPLGDSIVLCKMIGSLQAVSIFVSTMSITAIALDRYQIIVYPSQSNLQKPRHVLVLAIIWLVSMLLAAPLFVWRTLKKIPIPLEGFPIQQVIYCIEDWPSENGRVLYSAGCILFQYALPITTVSIAHARICSRLRYRLTSLAYLSKDSRKQAQEGQRIRKTNTLLVTIAMIFGICWMPLNIYNVVVDFYNPFGEDTESMLIIYAVCHMCGMSSACANPLLYGWLNDNFRKEFVDIARQACCQKSLHRRSTKPRIKRRSDRLSTRITDFDEPGGVELECSVYPTTAQQFTPTRLTEDTIMTCGSPNT